MKTYAISRTTQGVNLLVKTDLCSIQTNPPKGEAFGFGFATLGSPDHMTLAREILRDWAIGHAPAPAAIVDEHADAFRAEFIAHRAVEEFEICETDIIRWHGARIDARPALGA